MPLAPAHSTLEDARARDAADPLRSFRARFSIPRLGHSGQAPSATDASVYLCGNSLGLLSTDVRSAVVEELDAWGNLGVEGHFKPVNDWYRAHEPCRQPLAQLIGAEPREVVAMNSLSANLHLLMLSFFRPAGPRCKILIESPCFPSDVYAVKSQLRLHGLSAADHLVRLRPREGEATIRTEDAEALFEREGHTIALALLAGVNYATGQWMDMERISAAARRAGCVMGWDLAHAAGNVPLRMHDWGADFAVWCSYKYLNSGPGAVGGAFVHGRHLDAPGFEAMNRLEGWWGNDPATRFQMGEEFVAVRSADAWQLSNPPILALAPLRASLEVFAAAGMPALRAKSVALTAYLEQLIRGLNDPGLSILTPSDPGARGCQLSIRVHEKAPGQAKQLLDGLAARGVIADFRRPDIIRASPAPLYNSYEDCWRFVEALRMLRADHAG